MGLISKQTHALNYDNDCSRKLMKYALLLDLFKHTIRKTQTSNISTSSVQRTK